MRICATHDTNVVTRGLSGIEIVTRERVEHLTSEQRAVIASNTSMFESLLSGSVVSSSDPAVTGNGAVNDMPYVEDEVIVLRVSFMFFLFYR